MLGVAVGKLDLKLTAPAGLRSRATELTTAAEQALIPAVLRAMERRLVQSYGDRAAIRIRSLNLNFKLATADLMSAGYAEAIGEDIAEQMLSMAVVETAAARSAGNDAPVRIWREARQLTAARLAMAARGETGPTEVKEVFAELWEAIANEPSQEIMLVLSGLAEAGELPAVLAKLPAVRLFWLNAQLISGAPPRVARAIAKALSTHRSRSEPRARPRRDTDSQIVERSQVEQSGKAGHRGSLKSAADPAPSPEVPETQDRAPPVPADRRRSETSDSTDRKPRAMPGRTAIPIPSTSLEDWPGAAQPVRSKTASAAPEPGPVEAEIGDDFDPVADFAPAWFSYPSTWCGLAYLLRIAIRTELPEALWQCGICEGDALARAFALIAGGDDDPVTRILSRRFPDAAGMIGHVPDWAYDEIETGALDRAIGFGADRATLVRRIAHFYAVFACGEARNLPAWLAAFLTANFEIATGIDVPAASPGQAFARDGCIVCEDDSVRIIQPVEEAIDVAIRRAGLDADPGWLPWLEKRLVFVFESEEASA